MQTRRFGELFVAMVFGVAACTSGPKSEPPATGPTGGGEVTPAPAPDPAQNPPPTPAPAPSPKPTPPPTNQSALPRSGEPCAAGNLCAAGHQCVEYYGIAGPSGPKFSSCEIRCTAKGGCPAGMVCMTISDGPGEVCRKN